MEYKPTSTPSSYPPPPPSSSSARPAPTPLTNAATAPGLYPAAASGAAERGRYSDHNNNTHVHYQQQQQQQQHQPPPQTTTISGGDSRSLQLARTTCEFAMREYLTQLRKIPVSSGGSFSVSDPLFVDAVARARAQQGLLLDELQALRRRVGAVVREAEAHRWRKWVFGGVLASIIPLVRRVFRRRSAGKDSNKKGEYDSNYSNYSNDTAAAAAAAAGVAAGSSGRGTISNATEYAFAKSRSLIKRIRASVGGVSWFLGGFATVAFFVLSVLYVFENEVSLRVAKTVSRRLKRLTAKIESGGESAGALALEEKDLAVLQQGWRWRVLTWSD